MSGSVIKTENEGIRTSVKSKTMNAVKKKKIQFQIVEIYYLCD